MKTYRIYQVDAFTRSRFCGNPAGVVPNADGLTDDQMQQIARELNNSETAFIFSPTSPDYDVEVRYFTPTTEVPLCGHATIAAHYVRAVERTFTSGRIVAKTKAGVLPVNVEERNGDYAIVMTQGAPEVGAPLDENVTARIAASLGLRKEELRADCPVTIASTGHSKVMVGIKSIEKLHSLKPNLSALVSISSEIGCNGYYVFTLNPGSDPLVHGRMFAPAIGIAEDPVTGNANGPLGIYLVHYGICQELANARAFDFSIKQGEAIRRAGTMRVHVDIDDGVPKRVQISGEAVIAFATTIDL